MQNTAYGMRIGDWSSDLFASDLRIRRRLVGASLLRRRIPEHAREPAGDRCAFGARDRQASGEPRTVDVDIGADGRRLRTQARSVEAAAEQEQAVGDDVDAAQRQRVPAVAGCQAHRSEEHTSELQSLMRISNAVLGCKKKITETQ